MSSASCLPIRLEIGRSRALALLLLLLHLGPLVPLFLALPILPAAALSLLSLFSLRQSWQRFVRRAARTSVIGLLVNGEKEWFLRQADSAELKATLHHAAVRQWLTLLTFDTRRGRRRAVILPDAVDGNPYHRLRVFLNYMQ